MHLLRQPNTNHGTYNTLSVPEPPAHVVSFALQRSAAERLGPGAAAAAPMQRMGGGGAAMPGNQAQGLAAPGPGFGPPPDRGFTTTQNGGGGGNFGGGGGGGGGFGPRGGPMPSVPNQYQPQQPFQQPPGRCAINQLPAFCQCFRTVSQPVHACWLTICIPSVLLPSFGLFSHAMNVCICVLRHG